MPSIPSQIRLLIEWVPALNIFSAIAAAKRGQERAVQVSRLAEFLASKTETDADDRLVRLITDILLTPQGGALVDYLSELVQAAAENPNGPFGHSGT
jgi:hypothetical protein